MYICIYLYVCMYVYTYIYIYIYIYEHVEHLLGHEKAALGFNPIRVNPVGITRVKSE